MTPDEAPAIAGGRPVRTGQLPYGRHAVDPADLAAVEEVLRSPSLTGGPEVDAFEVALAAACGTATAVAVSSGTAALHVALAALGVGPGDEVVTTPLTFVATANAVLFTGARPVFADVGADRLLDPASVAASLTDRTRAVVGVDYSGLPCDGAALRDAAKGLPLVVDAAHSLGASADGRPVGARADVTTLSFHPVKHIATGEGGACLTDDLELAARMRRLRNHGMTSSAAEREGGAWKYDVVELGNNYRLSAIQAALGRSQLTRLEANVRSRGELSARYDEMLGAIPGVCLPPRQPGRASAWHIYPIEIDPEVFGWERDAVIDGLRADNIQATLHYPAVHTLKLYADLGYKPGVAPVAERLSRRLVTLPLFPQMTEADQVDVVTSLRRMSAWRH